MNKVFAILLLVAIATTACNTDEQHHEETPDVLHALHFGLSVPSRAMVDTEEDLHDESISLFGMVTRPDNGTTQLFANDNLYWEEPYGWRYDNLQFWIKGGVYHFMAIYPYTTRSYSYNTNDGSLSLINYSAGYAACNEDLMYAVATRDLSNIGENSYIAVPLPLKHAKARVEFYLTNASGETITNIANVSLTGLYYIANLNISATGLLEWTIDQTKRADDINIFGGVCTVPEGGIPSNIDLEPHSLFDVGAITVLPQRVSKSNITLNFDLLLENESIASEFHLDLGTIVAETTPEWEAGKRYVYNLTLTENTISFDVNIVDWIEDRIEL